MMIEEGDVGIRPYEKPIKSPKAINDTIINSVSDAWSSSITYGVNAYCIYNNSMWKCLVQHSNVTPSEGTYWTKVSIGSELKTMRESEQVYKITGSSLISSDWVSLINGYDVPSEGTYVFCIRFGNETENFWGVNIVGTVYIYRTYGINTNETRDIPISVTSVATHGSTFEMRTRGTIKSVDGKMYIDIKSSHTSTTNTDWIMSLRKIS